MVLFLRQGCVGVVAAVLGLSCSPLVRAAEPFRGLQEESSGALIPHGVPCTPCLSNPGSDCTLKFKVNLFAGATGYYEIEDADCVGVNPTLYLTVGRTYLFDQSDDTNWFHLLGFAYEADGAHVGVDELEPGISRSTSNCTADLSCPAPMYYLDGEYVGVYSNIPELVPVPAIPSDDFGLGTVEPLFFHPLGDWQGYGSFVVALNFNDEDYEEDIFYFCHLHPGMSGRIKLLDANGNLTNPEDTPALPYEYDRISEFDYGCGTFNLTDFRDPTSTDQCPDFTVCPGDVEPGSGYAECVEAMNCHMMASMTTNAVGRSELFCHQMIPHHENAVNMAKALLYIHGIECDTSGPVEEGSDIPWQCEMRTILLDIINDQNKQIFDMRDALSQLSANEFEDCEVTFGANVVISKRNLGHVEPPQFMTDRRIQDVESNPFPSGIDCTPCEGTTDDCTVIVSVNLTASRWGYYEVQGCEGVNPTLHLTVGRTYLFDQSDVSNWYHLIGFSYEADGAHAGVDELEPGIAPGNASCADTLSCPAPMYWMNGTYVGNYSNIPDLVPIPDVPSDDFGLGNVEPLFFHPLSHWIGYGHFVTALNFDVPYDKDIFYFCHVHSGMSARIKLHDVDGNMLSKENEPEIPYEYDTISQYDASCGTFGLDVFKTQDNPQCPSHFVCYDGAGTIGVMADCIDSMNCAMLDGMSVKYGDAGMDTMTNDVILFIRMMIPHHENAVNMAKHLLISGEVNCVREGGPVEEGDAVPTACLLDPIIRGIINNQNKQIQIMKGILEGFGVPEFSVCDVAGTEGDSGTEESSSTSLLALMGALVAGLAIV